ncbi:MAG: DUF4337 family protein [Bdellovibrio sp.]|nr:DUF4337 family protein [Bdellovibrio sp.]
MSELEAPTEAISEELHHRAHEAIHHESNSDRLGARWISQVALSSAVIAVLAAIAAMVGNHDANEAMMKQIQASDQWSYYQAKSIKATVLNNKMEIMEALGKPVSTLDKQKIAEYKREQEDIADNAQENEKEATFRLHRHVIFSRAVTLFQIAIATAAIAVLARRKLIWHFGLGFSLLGAVFLAQGFLT